MPVRMRIRATHAAKNWVSIKKFKKDQTFFTRQHRNMLCLLLLRVVAVLERKTGLLCPSITLQYVFNPPSVLPLLVVCCPSSSAALPVAPHHSLPAVHLPSFQGRCFSLLFFYLSKYAFKKKIQVDTLMRTLNKSASLLKDTVLDFFFFRDV